MNNGTDLITAISAKSEDLILKLLQNGADATQVNYFNDTALQVALKKICSDRTVQLLLQYGGRGDYKALMLAIEHGYNENIIGELIKHGAQANETDYLGRNGLHTAAATFRFENRKVLELLIKCGADVNQPANCNLTPLFFAIDKSNIVVIDSLLHYGANPCQKMDNGYPIEYAFSLPPFTVENVVKYAALYVNHSNESEIAAFFKHFQGKKKLMMLAHQCIEEINVLKENKVTGAKRTLFDFIISQGTTLDSFRNNENSMDEIVTHLTTVSCPMYREILVKKLSRSVIKSKILKSSAEKRWCVAYQERRIYLHTDAVENIIKYLSEVDALNLLISFTSSIK